MLKRLTENKKLDIFKNDDIDQIYLDLYIKDIEPYIFKKHENPKDIYYDFLFNLSEVIEVSPHNMMIVGSARNGFSLNPNQNKNRFLKNFVDYEDSDIEEQISDIDIVIVSSSIFHEICKEITNEYHKVGVIKKEGQLGQKVLKGFFDFYHFTEQISSNIKEWEKKLLLSKGFYRKSTI